MRITRCFWLSHHRSRTLPITFDYRSSWPWWRVHTYSCNKEPLHGTLLSVVTLGRVSRTMCRSSGIFNRERCLFEHRYSRLELASRRHCEVNQPDASPRAPHRCRCRTATSRRTLSRIWQIRDARTSRDSSFRVHDTHHAHGRRIRSGINSMLDIERALMTQRNRLSHERSIRDLLLRDGERGCRVSRCSLW